MGKKGAPGASAKQAEKTENVLKNEMQMKLSNLQENSDLWYKIKVLLHDLCNIATDREAEARTLRTTNELYISSPYFTPKEAALIKTTIVSKPVLNEIPEFEALNLEDNTDSKAKDEAIPETMSVEDAIKSCLQNFFEKRKASGDARPCGPHDLGPIYQVVFGITKEELRDERFLGRLRRIGLGQSKGDGSKRESDDLGKKKVGKKR